MGYTKLNYEDYQENIDYWLGSEGVELPLWASQKIAQALYNHTGKVV